MSPKFKVKSFSFSFKIADSFLPIPLSIILQFKKLFDDINANIAKFVQYYKKNNMQ